MSDKLKMKHYRLFWKYFMKASNIDDYDKEIQMEDLHNPDSIICSVIIFIASIDDTPLNF